MSKAIIGMTDEFTKKITMECVVKAMPEAQLIDGSNDLELFFHLQREDDQVILIFDRFFLSYILVFILLYLKIMNSRIKIIFCDQGDCNRDFGSRLYDLDVDGYICNIENEKSFVEKLKKIARGDKCYPDEMKDSTGHLDLSSERKGVNEITPSEFKVAVYLGKGYTKKEVSRITGISDGGVRNHVHWLKKKIGWKGDADFALLNKRFEELGIRSWNDCKN